MAPGAVPGMLDCCTRATATLLTFSGPVAVARAVAGGAHAIKIEAPWGDPLEHLCKPWYDELHSGVRVEHLDLKSPAGLGRIKTLLADADAFWHPPEPAACQPVAPNAHCVPRDAFLHSRRRCMRGC